MAFKFKMNERSLFAVLLRSPWWISLLISVLMSVAAFALLPREYAVVVMLGTFPFVVVAAIAAWRQLHAPSPARLAQALERAAAMSWRDFALAMEQAWQRQGFSVTRLEGTVADFRLERQGQTSLLSCRRWKAASHGVEILRELRAACEQQGAQGIYLCLAPVSDVAEAYAKASGLRLIHGEGVAVVLLQAGTP
jgi:restriction system protein